MSRFNPRPGRRRGDLGRHAQARPARADFLPSLPEVTEPVYFDQHIRPLFSDRDRTSMRFAFDLWSYDDVVEHAEGIAHCLAVGSMPCDGAWPAERVEIFRRWMQGGTPRAPVSGPGSR